MEKDKKEKTQVRTNDYLVDKSLKSMLIVSVFMMFFCIYDV